MGPLAELREVLRARRQRRRSREQLRRDLREFRTSAERHEIEAILERYGTTVEDLLAGQDAPPSGPARAPRRDWEDAWDEIVLDLSSDDD